MRGIYNNLTESQFVDLFNNDEEWRGAFSNENLRAIFNDMLAVNDFVDDHPLMFSNNDIGCKYLQATRVGFIEDTKDYIEDVENMGLDDIERLIGVINVDSEGNILYQENIYMFHYKGDF